MSKVLSFNGFSEKEVHVRQPLDFKDHTLPNRVFKLQKALYGMKQPPRTWFEKLSSFLLENDFMKDKIDTIIFKRS